MRRNASEPIHEDLLVIKAKVSGNREGSSMEKQENRFRSLNNARRDILMPVRVGNLWLD